MFGYVMPQKSELKVRELARYEAYYCGLCVELGKRLGQAARLTLNYDCAFLAVLLCGMEGEDVCTPMRCPYKPLKKPRPVAPSSETMEFCADLNLALAWHKLGDDRRDEKFPRAAGAAAAKAALALAYRKMKKLRPGLAETIEAGIGELTALEREGCAELDAPPDAFGRMLRLCALEIPYRQERSKKVTAAIAYDLGKWIYLADAWDDRDKDKKTGAYNVFLSAGADAQRAEFLMRRSLNGAIDAYWLAEPRSNGGIVENILIEGCGEKTRLLMGGKFEK